MTNLSGPLMSTLFQIFEIGLAVHSGGSHARMNNVIVNFSVRWDNDRAETTIPDVNSMIPNLSIKDKSVFKEDAFKNLPVNRCYAR